MATAKTDLNGNLETGGATGTYIVIGTVRHYGFSTAITENVTTTSAPAGSVAQTSHATGRTKSFYADGTKWQLKVAA